MKWDVCKLLLSFFKRNRKTTTNQYLLITRNMKFEDFSSAKYHFPKSGQYTVSTNIEEENILVVIAYGTSLENAHISSYGKSDRGSVTFTIDDHRDVNNEVEPQYLWVFTYVKPSWGYDKLYFGQGIGEYNKAIAEVDFHLNNDPKGINYATCLIPNRALIPADCYVEVNEHIASPGYNNATFLVVHDPRDDNPIQAHAQVLSMNLRTQKVGTYWNGEEGHNTPLNMKLDARNPIYLCAIIKSNEMEDGEHGTVSFAFEVGDPRREAIVTVTEEV